jgi:hypothetical protein
MELTLGRRLVAHIYVDGTLYIQSMDRQQIQEINEQTGTSNRQLK